MKGLVWPASLFALMFCLVDSPPPAFSCNFSSSFHLNVTYTPDSVLLLLGKVKSSELEFDFPSASFTRLSKEEVGMLAYTILIFLDVALNLCSVTPSLNVQCL